MGKNDFKFTGNIGRYARVGTKKYQGPLPYGRGENSSHLRQLLLPNPLPEEKNESYCGLGLLNSPFLYVSVLRRGPQYVSKTFVKGFMDRLGRKIRLSSVVEVRRSLHGNVEAGG